MNSSHHTAKVWFVQYVSIVLDYRITTANVHLAPFFTFYYTYLYTKKSSFKSIEILMQLGCSNFYSPVT
jgi:hypothetical protein